MDISELLAFVVKNKASDLHLSAGLPPMIRVHGDVRRINLPPLEHKDVHAMVYDIMNDGQRKFYEENLECDFSFEIPNLARFRVNAFNQNRGAGGVFRTIPSKVLSLEDLKAPKVFGEIANQPRGVGGLFFDHLTTSVGQGIKTQVQRADAQRLELGVGLHQRRAGMDLEAQFAVGALLDLGGEFTRQPVAEVALSQVESWLIHLPRKWRNVNFRDVLWLSTKGNADF